jgi:hypothetical protein
MYLDLRLLQYKLIELNDSQEAKLLNYHKYTTDNSDAKPQPTLFSGKSNLHLGSSLGTSEHQFWQTNTSLMGVVSPVTAYCSPRGVHPRNRRKPTYVRNVSMHETYQTKSAMSYNSVMLKVRWYIPCKVGAVTEKVHIFSLGCLHYTVQDIKNQNIQIPDASTQLHWYVSECWWIKGSQVPHAKQRTYPKVMHFYENR